MILKDFLRELPEPVCTDAMFHMLLDAISVQMTGEGKINNQIMMGIVECCPKTNQVRNDATYFVSFSETISNQRNDMCE